ncbi:hypothetical protein Q8W71_13830 [Methylobacterium sp. NEAU 140]|uniref:baseplate hub protein n=1 Tax=Methylobacterium sp. NEAU 140 TaxID=3064945 RepID=UPI002736C5B8|nr:hypothetical protein [Methylobacterium sp. NEAU 140]MDP4023711.1 hypothetical protein [Methylobacterium sp. NEAU 140]
MSLTQKLLRVDISLASGNFQGGGNSASLTGLRTIAKIVKAGGASMGGAQITVFGMTLSKMNQLTQYGLAETLIGKNTVTVFAGEDPNAMSMVFKGTILTAFMDGNSAPQVGFRINAAAGLFEAAKPAEPTSMKGSADAAQMMERQAKAMGLQFENSGIDTKLQNPYFWGAARHQAKCIAKAAGMEWIIDCDKLAIWKPGQPREGDTIEYAPGKGLVGYPTFNSKGVVLTTEFNPTLKYGSKIKVKSDITPACGEWVVYRLEYDLASMLPRGPWFCVIDAARPGQVPVA